METWEYGDKSYYFYDWLSRDFFEFLKDQDRSQTYWRAPGNGSHVYRSGEFEPDAEVAFEIALEAIDDLDRGWNHVATSEWREIYGVDFPHLT
jgi:hypothetical protein